MPTPSSTTTKNFNMHSMIQHIPDHTRGFSKVPPADEVPPKIFRPWLYGHVLQHDIGIGRFTGTPPGEGQSMPNHG